MYQKRMFNAKCTDCGKSTTLPFEPAKGKPVYCKTCFSKHRIKYQERSNLNVNDTKHAWAIFRDDWQGRKEEKHHNIFQMT
jgi:CxxC-x17-CxxC domain-containing protein